ncbi:MAG: folylpolyglutamate synthase/dihydrofolate synthase family protein [Cyanobacteria bacterium J06627_8]
MNPSDSSASTHPEIDRLLDSFGRFGVDLSLDRILTLLKELGNPHHQVPIIHVAGTNGKGSVCAYLSSVLTHAGYRVGRYTSPHLVNWTERICINDRPIAPDELLALLIKIQQVIGSTSPSPTQFEVFTAAMWLYFARQSVDIAVIEVGLGGRLDATNVCDRPLVSVITSISRDHWQRLGPTLADIAGEKAGILKSGCPTVIGTLPPDAETVVKARVQALSCPVLWVPPAQEVKPGVARLGPLQLPDVSSEMNHERLEPEIIDRTLPAITYPIALFGQHQLMNSALAIATIQLLQHQGWTIDESAIQRGMAETQWPARIQWVSVKGIELLIDGAHNTAAAHTLREYVDYADRVSQPIHWVMGMLSTKDHHDIFEALLRSGDRLSIVPVPDHQSADPAELAVMAQQICPTLSECRIYSDVSDALSDALKEAIATNSSIKLDAAGQTSTTVLCGSLYLIGYVFKHYPFERSSA